MSAIQPTAYIAGPMRGYPEWNFPAFHAAEKALQEVGYLTINPARRDEELGLDVSGVTAEETEGDVDFDINEALAWDLDQIAKVADCVVVLEGWEDSKGAQAEVATAKALGKPVKTLDQATLAGWKKGDRVRFSAEPFYLYRGRPTAWAYRPDSDEPVIDRGPEEMHFDHRGNVSLEHSAFAIACLELVEPVPASPGTEVTTLKQVRELPIGTILEDENGGEFRVIPAGIIRSCYAEYVKGAAWTYPEHPDLVKGGGFEYGAERLLADHTLIIKSLPEAVKDEGDWGADDEVRVVSATGGEKGRKTAELASVDPLALLTLAEVSGMGARKYEAFNYLRGYDWSLSMNALQRHTLAFWNGQDLDEESGLPHMAHAAWHALALVSFLKRDLGTDDRFKQEVAA